MAPTGFKSLRINGDAARSRFAKRGITNGDMLYKTNFLIPMPLSNAERQARARVRNLAERKLQRLSQWVSRSAYEALGHIASVKGVTRSKALEELILREEMTVITKHDAT